MRQQSSFARIVQSGFVYIVPSCSQNGNRFARIGFSHGERFGFLSSQFRSDFAEQSVLFFGRFRGYSGSRSRNRSRSRGRIEERKPVVELTL